MTHDIYTAKRNTVKGEVIKSFLKRQQKKKGNRHKTLIHLLNKRK